MPILKIYVTEDVQKTIQTKESIIKNELVDLVNRHFNPKPGTQQIILLPCVAVLEGHRVLIEILHRHNESRTLEVRQAFSEDLASLFSNHLNLSIRVRTIAIEQSLLAAKDIEEDL